MSQAHTRRARTVAVVAIVLAQWFSTSLWFSPSGVSESLSSWLGLTSVSFAWLLAATQSGFIVGTIVSALTGLADRFPAERIFVICSLLGASLNIAWTLVPASFAVTWAARFGVGILLAGIYPMGMKMIVRRSAARSGSALGWLVAMLTLGTAMPHILRALGAALPWQSVIWGASILAVIGAVLILGIRRTANTLPAATASDSARPRSGGLHAVMELIRIREYRSSCAGYIGHMWELYAFWAVVPVLVMQVLGTASTIELTASLAAVVIGAGAVGCVLGGWASRRWGSENVAAGALAVSGAMCLVYPLIPEGAGVVKFATLAMWGFFVIADSPQFSAVTARYVPARLVGTALTVQNALGFFVTVISIVLLQEAIAQWGTFAVWLLLPGPALGLFAMRSLLAVRAAP